MVNLNGLIILCLVRLARPEDRISVDTVGTMTATAGYSVSDNTHSPAAVTAAGRLLQTSSSTDFSVAVRGPSKDESSSSGSSSSSSSDETYTAPVPELRHNSQSLALRSRQARGKANGGNAQWHHDRGSVEDKDVAAEITSTFPFTTDHRVNEQLYNVKPQTFSADRQPSSSSSSDAKSGESVEKSVPYGKKTQKGGGGGDFDDEEDDRRPVFNDWSGEVRGEKPSRSRKKNRNQMDAATSQEKRRPHTNNMPAAADGAAADADKDGWREVSPNMEIATGYSATVQHLHESSQEASGSSESLSTHPIMYHSDSGSDDGGNSGGGGISSIENVAQTEPQNFNHKQVLSKMNHFDFSNAVSPTNKTPALREKRLNYQPGGNAVQQSPPVRYAFSGGGSGQPLKALQQVPSPVPSSPASVKSVKIEQPAPNYHNIIVPMPVSHQMYAAIGSSDMVHGHQLASSTMQQAMMSLPVVHNVFFKTDEHGGGKTMPAIVIPLKPEYLQQLQHQQYLHAVRADADTDSQNAAGHQRPVHVTGDTGTKTFHYQQQQQLQQQQQQQQQQPATVAYQQQKSKSSKVKKPYGPIKDDRVKQPFNLHQHQFYNVPFAAGHLQHGSHPNHGGHLHAQQHDRDPSSDDSPRYGHQATGASSVHPYPAAVGHSLIVKRPHAYGYTPSAKYKSPQQQQQQQMSSAEEVAAAVVQHNNVQPYRATTYHPGFAYLNGPDDDYPYRPIYKDAKKRNDVLVVRTDRRK